MSDVPIPTEYIDAAHYRCPSCEEEFEDRGDVDGVKECPFCRTTMRLAPDPGSVYAQLREAKRLIERVVKVAERIDRHQSRGFKVSKTWYDELFALSQEAQTIVGPFPLPLANVRCPICSRYGTTFAVSRRGAHTVRVCCAVCRYKRPLGKKEKAKCRTIGRARP